MADEAFPKTIEYDEGKTVELKLKPKRVFVGYVGALDILSEFVPVENVVAAPQMCVEEKYSNCPEYAKKIPHLFSKLEIELVHHTNPDLLILASFNDLRFIEHIKGLKIPYVLISKHESYQDIVKQIQLLGDLLGEEKKAQEVINALQAKKEGYTTLGQTCEKKTVMTLGVNYYTAGSKTIIHDMISIANLENVSSTNGIVGFKKISIEELIAWDPDWIIVESDAPNYKETFLNKMIKNKSVSQLKAIKNQNILVLHPKIASAISPKFIDGTKEMLLQIHGCPKDKIEE